MVEYVRNDGSTICTFYITREDMEDLDCYYYYKGKGLNGFNEALNYFCNNNMYREVVNMWNNVIECSFKPFSEVYNGIEYGEKFFKSDEYKFLIDTLLNDHNAAMEFFQELANPDDILRIEYKGEDAEMCMSLGITRIVVHNNKVMIMYFDDDTFTKAICSDNDTFNFDAGVQTCIMKKLYGDTMYHKIMRDVRKLYDRQEQEKKELIEQKRQRRAAQEARHQKNLARANKQREQFKNDISEAVLAALSGANIDIYDATKDEINTEGDDLK